MAPLEVCEVVPSFGALQIPAKAGPVDRGGWPVPVLDAMNRVNGYVLLGLFCRRSAVVQARRELPHWSIVILSRAGQPSQLLRL